MQGTRGLHTCEPYKPAVERAILSLTRSYTKGKIRQLPNGQKYHFKKLPSDTIINWKVGIAEEPPMVNVPYSPITGPQSKPSGTILNAQGQPTNGTSTQPVLQLPSHLYTP